LEVIAAQNILNSIKLFHRQAKETKEVLLKCKKFKKIK
jgi:hypothetical protein